LYLCFFQTNTNIEILNLEGNAIDEDGAICLTKVLKENFFITELVSIQNKRHTKNTSSSMSVCDRDLSISLANITYVPLVFVLLFKRTLRPTID